jgi:N-acetylmuramoyl-L-alanine amidase
MGQRWRGAAVVLAVVVVASTASAATGGGAREYTVRRGDTVDGIAARFGTTPALVIAANQLANPNLIIVGQQLDIPGLPPVPGSSGLPVGTPAPGGSASGGFHWPAKPTPPLAPVPTPRSGSPQFPAGLTAYPARLALRPDFQHWARVEGISAGLLEAVAWVESGWQARVVSPTGAVGVAQIEPPTAAFISHDLLGLPHTLDSRRPNQNIEMEAAYLAFLLRQTNGSVANAVGGYYQGLTSLLKHGPLPSARRYVSLVGRLWNQFHSG